MEDTNQSIVEISSPAQTKPTALQTTLAVLFILLMLFEWIVSPILGGKMNEESLLLYSLPVYIPILLWGFALFIARNNEMRIACGLLLAKPIILEILYAFLPISNPVSYLLCFFEVIYSAYAISIFLNCTSMSSPITKWLILWLSITIINIIMWQGFERIEIFNSMNLYSEDYESYTKAMSVFENGSRYYLGWLLSVFIIIIYWNVFRSALFSGYTKDSSSKLALPFFFNRYVIGSLIVIVTSVLILSGWFHVFVL